MQTIRKELDEYDGDYDETTARKPHSDCRDERISVYVGEIQATIDNNLS